jgi:hypothetical protein
MGEKNDEVELVNQEASAGSSWQLASIVGLLFGVAGVSMIISKRSGAFDFEGGNNEALLSTD